MHADFSYVQVMKYPALHTFYVPRWSPTYDVSAILTSIQSLLDEPNPNSPANSLAAQLYMENRYIVHNILHTMYISCICTYRVYVHVVSGCQQLERTCARNLYNLAQDSFSSDSLIHVDNAILNFI